MTKFFKKTLLVICFLGCQLSYVTTIAQIAITENNPNHIKACQFSKKTIQVSTTGSFNSNSCVITALFNSLNLEYDQNSIPPLPVITNANGCSPVIGSVVSSYTTGLQIDFSISNMAANCTFEIDYWVKAKCSAPQTVVNAIYSSSCYSYTSPVFSCNTMVPQLGIPQNGITTNGVVCQSPGTNVNNIGQTFTRRLTIKNTGETFDISIPGNQQIIIFDESLNTCSIPFKFYHVDYASCALPQCSTSVTVGTVQQITLLKEAILLNEADILLLTGDGILNQGEEFYIELLLEVDDCMCQNIESSQYSVSYKCNDTDPDNCILSNTQICDFVKAFYSPSALLPVFTKLSSNTCYNTSGASQMQCVITNTGSGVAVDVDLNLFFNSITNQNTYYTNFQFFGTAINPSVSSILPNNNFGCASAPSGYTISCDGIPAAGGNLIITWESYTCCPVNDCSTEQIQDGWRYNGTYSNQCGNVLTIAPNNVLTPKSINKADLFYEGPNDVDEGAPDPFIAEFTINAVASFAGNTVNLNNQQFEVEIDLVGPDLYFIPGTLNLGDIELYVPNLGITITPSSVTSTSITCGTQTLHQHLNAFFDNVNVGLLRLLDVSNGSLIRLNDAIIRFKFRATCDCPALTHATDDINISLFHHPDISCSPECRINVGCTTKTLDMHCPGCLRQGIHSFSYNVKRLTFGYQDSDNDSRWEQDLGNPGNPLQIDNTYLNTAGIQVKQNRAMVGDIIEGTLSTAVIIDPNYGPWYGTPTDFGFGLGELTYGRWETIFTYPANDGHVTPQEVEVKISNVRDLMGNLVPNPQNGGLSEWTIIIPGTAVIEPPYNPLLNGGVSVFNMNISMANLNQWYFNSTGFNLPFTQYRNGMSIIWKHRWLVDGNIGPVIMNCDVDNLIYLGLHDESGGILFDPDCLGLELPSDYTDYCNAPYLTGCATGTPPACLDFQWYCTKYGGSFTMVGFNFNDFFYGFTPECGAYLNYNYILSIGPPDPSCFLSAGEAGRNVFPFEFRNWLKMDEVNLTVPPTYSSSPAATVWQRFSVGTNCSGDVQGSVASTGTNPKTFDYGSEYYSGMETVSTNPIFTLANADDDFYIENWFYNSPSCATAAPQPDTADFVRTIDIFGQGVNLGLGATVYPAVGTKAKPPLTKTFNIIYNYSNPPSLALSANTPNGTDPTVCWTVVIENMSTSHPANFTWFSIPNFANGITITSFSINGGAQLPILANNVYGLGHLTKDIGTLSNQVTITLCGTYICGNPTPNFEICYGWNCAGYPAGNNPANAVCTPQCQTLTVNVPFNPSLEVNLTPPASITTCSTALYKLEIKNTQYNFIKDVAISVDFPSASGFTFVPGSARICYPYSTGCNFGSATTITSAPVVLGNTLIWDLNSITPAFPNIVDGIPGLLSTAGSGNDDWHLCFYFEVATSCDVSFNPTDYLKFHVDAKTNCDVDLDWGDFFNNPYLTATSSPFDDLSISTSINPFASCSDLTQGTVTITNNSSTQTANHCNNFISLSVPNDFVASNISNGGVFGMGNITWPASVVCVPGIPPLGSVTLTFDLIFNSVVGCGNHNINGNIQVVDQLNCGLNPPCSINTSLSSSLAQVTITPPSSAFTLPGTNPCIGQPVNFAPDVICSGLTYEWNIDGTIYTGANVSHTFSQSGSFNVILTTSIGVGGCSSQTNGSINIDVCGGPCSGTNFTYVVDGCTVDFTGIAPPSYAANCDAVMYQWNFGDGTPPTSYDPSNLVTHTYVAGTYFVWMAAICFDILDDGTWVQTEYCKVGMDVTVTCNEEPCKDIDFITDIRGCNVDFTAMAPNISGCVTTEYTWDFGDGTNSGVLTTNTATHTYSSNNTYKVCLEINCKDANGNILYTCKVCKDVKVECGGCDNTKLSYEITDCEVKLFAETPSMNNCASIEYAWDFGDGSALPAQIGSDVVTYTFCESGVYKVCFEAYCYDSQGNLLYTCQACEFITVSCSDPFCKKILNAASGSFTGVDVGKEIVSTPDGGYVIVGSVNANSTSPSGTNSSNEGDTYFVKYGSSNNIQFQLRMGDNATAYYNERGYTVLVRPDGYYVAGITYKSYGVDHDIQITKVSLTGGVLWSKRYGHNNSRKDDVAKLLDMSSNGLGNILVVGSSNNSAAYCSPWDISLTNYDFMIFAIDPDGIIVANSSKRIAYNSANTSSEYARDAIKIAGTNGPEYIITGDYSSVCSGGCTGRDIYSVKLDQNLVLVTGASQLLSSSNSIETVSSIESVGGRIFIAGSVDQTNTNERILVAELNPATLVPGTTRLIDNSMGSDAKALDLTRTPDDKLLIAGRCGSTTNNDALSMKFNVDGGFNIDWAVYSNNTLENDFFQSVSDNYTLVGVKHEAAPNNQEIFIAKVCPSTGSSCCLQPLATSVSTIAYAPNVSGWSTSVSLVAALVSNDTPIYSDPFICPSQTRISSGEKDENTHLMNSIKVYPNPNTGEFIIEFSYQDQVIDIINILDFSGRIAYSIKPTEHSGKQYHFKLDNLPTGIYIVEVIAQTSISKSKFVIQK